MTLFSDDDIDMQVPTLHVLLTELCGDDPHRKLLSQANESEWNILNAI